MDQEKVGKLILYLRKKYGLTQQELADKLHITAKAISKWECGLGLPDITILQELSRVFNITTDELLSGELKEHQSKKKNKRYILIMVFVLILIVIGLVFTFLLRHQDKEKENNCTVIRTYYIDNIGKSNDDNYLYITVHEYQVEGTFTMKLSKLIGSNLEVGNSYEFTFRTTDKYLNTTTDILFNNSEVINLVYSSKVGNEIVSKYYCDKEDKK